jgi:hypothetical protein
MNWGSWLLWGFASTLLLTLFSEAAQGLGLTRINVPYMLGTMFTPDRDRAQLYGFVVHLVAGWLFSLLYIFIFQSIGAAGWWRGTVLGILHGSLMLTVVMSLMPGIHPRMASEQHGPEAQNMLEPPGFLAMNYGLRTPIAVILSHAIFGAILGNFYHLR